jgi:tetratricopeptide (TPR) repeat protein
MYYYDHEDNKNSRQTYPGRDIVLGIQALLIVGIIFFGLQALDEANHHADWSMPAYETSSAPQMTSLDYRVVQLHNLGINYKQQGEYDEAIAVYDEAIDLMPEFSWLHLNRGVVYETIGDEALADQDFWRFMRIHVNEMRHFSNFEMGETISIAMRDGRLVSFPFSARKGDMMSFSAIAQNSDITDPLIVVIDDNGRVIGAQDDTFSNDNTWLSMDASMPYTVITSDCDNCQLIVGHAGGGSDGIIDVTITPHTQIGVASDCEDEYGW